MQTDEIYCVLYKRYTEVHMLNFLKLTLNTAAYMNITQALYYLIVFSAYVYEYTLSAE